MASQDYLREEMSRSPKLIFRRSDELILIASLLKIFTLHSIMNLYIYLNSITTIFKVYTQFMDRERTHTFKDLIDSKVLLGCSENTHTDLI